MDIYTFNPRRITKISLFALLSCSLALGMSSTQADQHEGDPALAFAATDSSLEWGPCPEFFGEGCHIAVLHGDPAQPNTDVFFRLVGGKVFPAHKHTSAERMVLVAGAMDVTYEGQDTVQLKAGMYAYGPAGRVHHGQCTSAEDCVLFIAFELPVDATEVAVE
jgi:quercetin dioxygenase-like cupin family protein